MPEVKAFNETSGNEMLYAVDFDGELYLRQERGGMLMAPTKACHPWSEQTTPWSFGHELLEPDIDRIALSRKLVLSIFQHFRMQVFVKSLMDHSHLPLMATSIGPSKADKLLVSVR